MSTVVLGSGTYRVVLPTRCCSPRILREVITWDDKWASPSLRHGDVYPLPLATETNWTAEGWEVNVVLLHDVAPNGYSSTPIWTYRVAYSDPAGQTTEEAHKVTQAATHAFALRLRDVLA